MLSLFRIQFQRFRIVIEEISQIIVAIKQWCQNFFFTVLQTKQMSIYLALYSAGKYWSPGHQEDVPLQCPQDWRKGIIQEDIIYYFKYREFSGIFTMNDQ